MLNPEKYKRPRTVPVSQQPPICYRPNAPISKEIIKRVAGLHGENVNQFIDKAVIEKLVRMEAELKEDGPRYEQNRLVREAKLRYELTLAMEKLGLPKEKK